MRILIPKGANKADITYELPSYEDQLTSKDKKKLFELLKKIQEGKSISEKVSKSFHDIRKVLSILIVDTHERRRDMFTLLHYAKFCKNEQAANDLLEEAKKHGLFEVFNDRKIVSDYLGSHGRPIRTYSTVEDGVVRVEGFESWDDNEVVNPNMIIATSDIPSDIVSLKSDEERKNSLIETIMEGSVTCNVPEDIKEVSDKRKENFYAEGQEEITDTIETGIQACKKINNGEDIDTYQSMCKRNKETQRDFTNSGRTVVKEPNTFRIVSFKPCVNDEASSIADKKSSTKAMQQRTILAGVIGVVLLVSGIVSHIMKMHTIAVVGIIAGLACISFAFHSAIEPSTKLEKVEQPLQSSAREHCLKKQISIL
ncbi:MULTISPECIES: hypothetical protein [Wolbachia]|uniref:hypothetical protein n=1 Tax=Wolbachia TaxID=953 RepID=UPI00098104D1|nr:hypothetical protein [Wolbachia pipientis]ONI58197.1 PQQ enzyme repeat family domain protein [Wolbachia pipientis wVitA]